MGVLFSFLFLAALGALLVGLFSPATVLRDEKKQTRKRVLKVWGTATFVLMVLAGMTSSPETSTPQASSQASADQPEPEMNQGTQQQAGAVGVGETLQVGDMAYTVRDVSYRSSVGNHYMEETTSGVFLILDVRIHNHGDETVTLSSTRFTLRDQRGREFRTSSDGGVALTSENDRTVLLMEEAQPGVATTGVLVYEVPNRGGYELHVSGGMFSNEKGVIQLD